MVMIGHASINEKGQVAGGQLGDQTGKEVTTRSWWDGKWNVLLRPSEQYAEKMAKACEAACANNCYGYDQPYRNTGHKEAQKVGYDLSKVNIKCGVDCSSLMTLCAIAGGVVALEYTGNAPTTSTMRRVFKATNQFAVLTDSKYLRNDKYLRRGDILVREGHHTVMVLTDGEEAKKDKLPADLVGKDIRTVSAINLNARASIMGTKLFILDAGESVNVVEEKDGWCKVEAWVSNKYLVK